MDVLVVLEPVILHLLAEDKMEGVSYVVYVRGEVVRPVIVSDIGVHSNRMEAVIELLTATVIRGGKMLQVVVRILLKVYVKDNDMITEGVSIILGI